MKDKLLLLKDYFKRQPDVVFAFLFGSLAKDKQMQDSDVDIAVYFKPLNKRIELEEYRQYPRSRIWFDLVDILQRDDVDVVVLNQANPTLASNVLENGIPLVIKDENLYSKFYEIITREAGDFYQFVEDYWQIYQHAESLIPQQRVRLIERLQYLEIQLQELSVFQKMTFEVYRDDKFQRRNIERWVENISNATIDIAKIILASEKKQMPKSYKEALLDFGFFFGLKEEETRRFSDIADLRNLLAHEYLNILYERIKNFLINLSPFYERLIDFVKGYIAT